MVGESEEDEEGLNQEETDEKPIEDGVEFGTT
jgi:hypothetical protein